MHVRKWKKETKIMGIKMGAFLCLMTRYKKIWQGHKIK